VVLFGCKDLDDACCEAKIATVTQQSSAGETPNNNDNDDGCTSFF